MARNKPSYPVLNGAGTILEAVPAIDPYDYAPSRQSGNTAGRPVVTGDKRSYFDTDLMMRLYWNAARGVWTDFTGTQR